MVLNDGKIHSKYRITNKFFGKETRKLFFFTTEATSRRIFFSDVLLYELTKLNSIKKKN